MSPQSNDFKAGYVAIVGEPNVGKSTLMNAFLNQKISIVTPKPQTTRQRVLGILSRDDAQIIFLDTPGLIKPKYLLHEKMLTSAQAALNDADVIVVMTEISRGARLPVEVEKLVVEKYSAKPILLVINKVDTIYKPEVLPVMAEFSGRGVFREVIPISALKQDNLDDLLKTLLGYLPVHEPFYPTDIVSDSSDRFFVAEFIREKVFEQFSDEIPYSTAVEIREYHERERGKTYINADIIVERDSQKGILIGAKGDALKAVGQAARQEIESFLQHTVFLELRVKVREHWREKEALLKNYGYSTNA
ncbi:MAG TPA: GTPase Era [Bacteroidota bacterium]